MAYEDVILYFPEISLCKINDAFKYASTSCRHEAGGFTLQRMIVNGKGPMTISIAQ